MCLCVCLNTHQSSGEFKWAKSTSKKNYTPHYRNKPTVKRRKKHDHTFIRARIHRNGKFDISYCSTAQNRRERTSTQSQIYNTNIVKWTKRTNNTKNYDSHKIQVLLCDSRAQSIVYKKSLFQAMFPLSMFATHTSNNVLKRSSQLIASVSSNCNRRFIATTKMVQIKVCVQVQIVIQLNWHGFCDANSCVKNVTFFSLSC